MENIQLRDLVRVKNDDLVGLLVAIVWERSALHGFEEFVTQSMIEHMESESGIYCLTKDFGVCYYELPERYGGLVKIENDPELHQLLIDKLQTEP